MEETQTENVTESEQNADSGTKTQNDSILMGLDDDNDDAHNNNESLVIISPDAILNDTTELNQENSVDHNNMMNDATISTIIVEEDATVVNSNEEEVEQISQPLMNETKTEVKVPIVTTITNPPKHNSHGNTNRLPTTSPKPSNEIEALNDEIATLLLTNKITLTTSTKLQAILRENLSLKEKNIKLKSLLSRSSKVSKDTKLELEKSQKEVVRLKQRIESLANRPTHMDLLADFETNFDRALMSLHSGNGEGTSSLQQSGEDTRPPNVFVTHSNSEQENVSTMLLAELSQTKSRIEHLDSLNKQLVQRATQLGKEKEQYSSQLERQTMKISNLELELRMAKMETENATREMKAKVASLEEMQMEIDLVTRSAMDANARAAEGMEAARNIQSDKAQIEELKAKVSALQEWAIASAEAKEAIVEENKLLERRLHQLESANVAEDSNSNLNPTQTLKIDNLSPNSKGKVTERKLWTQSSSLVISAGTIECRVIDFGDHQVMDFETIILRWKFDLTPNNMDIMFSLLKGKFNKRDRTAMKNANSLIRERRVVGGGGGEVEGAFAIQNACTFVFSNEHSWIYPRTIKYEIEAYAIL